MTEPLTQAGRALIARWGSVSLPPGGYDPTLAAWRDAILAIEREARADCVQFMERMEVVRSAPHAQRIRNALTDEDEIAHGEAWDDARTRGLGVCAYCDDGWPCRTQRGINRLLRRITPEPADAA